MSHIRVGSICQQSLQVVFDDDEMDRDTGAGLSASTTVQSSYFSASTYRRKRGKRVVTPGQNRTRARRPTVSEEPSEDEDEDEDFSQTTSKATEKAANDNTGMADHMSTDDGGGSPSAAGAQEDGEVRKNRRVFRILTRIPESLRNIGRDQIPRLTHPR